MFNYLEEIMLFLYNNINFKHQLNAKLFDMIRNICYNFLQITILLLNRLNITPKVDDHILGIYSLVYIISTHNFVSPKTNRDEDIVIAS